MKTIDFRNGIMAKPIDDNFKEVDEAIRQERLNIGGYGVSYGLDSTINQLAISFKSGHVIDKKGYSYAIPETTLIHNPPVTLERTEESDVLYDGTIFLKYVPYAINGMSENEKNNIYVEADGLLIDVIDINTSAIKISRDFAFRKVKVRYRYALSRIDSIVIDSDRLVIVEGISSESPSIRPQDEAFCVASILVDPYGKKEESTYFAQLAKVHEQDHLRNVYTNSNNELFLNGTKLSELGFIYFEKPSRPTPNMLWYDSVTHKLYAYIAYEWVAIDNQSMAPVSEYKLIEPENCPVDLKTFIFHHKNDINVHFMAGQNELKVMIDQYPLFRDQYEEITYRKALDDDELRPLLLQYGYTLEENFNATYDNVGIGFRLTEPLKTPSYVQVEVIHRVVDANVHSRHQRSASFVHTAFIDLEADQLEFETNQPYRYNENQIQLFTADKNLFEHFDYREVGENQGELSNKVQLTRAFGYSQRIHYRITTNVYSYDHVSSLLENVRQEGGNHDE